MKGVALWCARQGLAIRRNSIHPAAILAPMWEPMPGKGPAREAMLAAVVAATPTKRFRYGDEVAALALLLASGEATYVTGSEFSIGGEPKVSVVYLCAGAWAAVFFAATLARWWPTAAPATAWPLPTKWPPTPPTAAPFRQPLARTGPAAVARRARARMGFNMASSRWGQESGARPAER
jgi:hypothetical protein